LFKIFIKILFHPVPLQSDITYVYNNTLFYIINIICELIELSETIINGKKNESKKDGEKDGKDSEISTSV